MTKIVRVSVTFPPDLLKEFDEITSRMGYDNRSKAVQDAVRAFITEHKLLRGEKGARVGVLVMVYDHEVKELESTLTDIEHQHSHIICSSMHIHLSERDCLEAIAVKGEAQEIQKLAETLATKKGVKQMKLTVVSP
ncbi:MAG: nickel-responsive transcriptional regulator NikR [Candidatus Bathyarchaeia archaeon]